jgi:26S proteasome regulatory subunit N5
VLSAPSQRERYASVSSFATPMAYHNKRQIFLETPRARVTLALALYHESLAAKPLSDSPKPAESLQTASDLLQELQVETYSSMELREKIEILLEQMRVLMLVARIKDEQAAAAGGLADGEADWVKMRVGGRKVNESFINKPENKVWRFRNERHIADEDAGFKDQVP